MSRRKKGLFVLLAVALALVATALALTFWWLTQQAMFVPGTVQTRVEAAKGSLEPLPDDVSPEGWRVAPDIELHHDSFGEGTEHVLYIHGGPGFPVRGRPAGLRRLAAHYRVHIYDARGCGASTRPFTRAPGGSFYQALTAVEGKLGLAQQVADIERIRRRLGRDRLVLVGHSFGGLVAALYASEFPQHVSALVLVSPAPLLVMPTPGPDLFSLVRARLDEPLRGEYDAYLASYFDLQAAMALDEPALSRHYGAFRRYYQASAGAGPPVSPDEGDTGGFLVLATYASLGRRHDWRGAMAHIEARTAVLHGDGDLMPEEETRAFAAAIPHASFELVHAGHFAVEEAPEVIEAAVDRLLGNR